MPLSSERFLVLEIKPSLVNDEAPLANLFLFLLVVMDLYYKQVNVRGKKM